MAKKEKEKTAEALKEKLFMKRKNAASVMTETEIAKADKYCEDYKRFLDNAKTEREACAQAEKSAVKAGFVPFDRNASY